MPVILHSIESGPREAPPLVLLHGFLGRSSDWQEAASHLSDAFRCIMIDLPGHGRSVGLPRQGYEWSEAIDAVAATLDHLEVAHCRLAGYSMGGRVALGFALRYRRRVDRLVLVSASAGLRDDSDRRQRVALDDERAAALITDLDSFLNVWYRMPLFASLDRRPRLRTELVAGAEGALTRSRRENDPVELAQALRGMSTGRMPSYWEILDDIGAPTLVVAGEEDRKFVNLAFRMAASGLPVLPRIIPGAGHLVPLEQPEHLAAVIRTFCTIPVATSEVTPASASELSERNSPHSIPL